MIHLTDQQYTKQLHIMRESVERIPLVLIDSSIIGDKDTQASWGLCSRLKEQWPDKETHMWPDDKRDEGSPYIYGIKYRADRHICPIQIDWEKDSTGCYYNCRIFQRALNNREAILELYDDKINLILQSGIL